MHRTTLLAIAVSVTFALQAPVLARPTASDRSGTLVLNLHDAQDHKFVYRTPIALDAIPDASMLTARQMEDYLRTARQAMAEHFGYTAALYGPDAYRMLGAVRIVGAWVDTGSQRITLGTLGNDAFSGELSDGLPPIEPPIASHRSAPEAPRLQAAEPLIGHALKVKALRN